MFVGIIFGNLITYRYKVERLLCFCLSVNTSPNTETIEFSTSRKIFICHGQNLRHVHFKCKLSLGARGAATIICKNKKNIFVYD